MITQQYTLNVRSRAKQVVLFSQDSRENKTNWFPEGRDIKCFVLFLDFHFNSNKRISRITGANQNSRLGTYNNTNLILKTTEWMFYKVLSLYHLPLFSPLVAVSLLGWLKNRCFLAWGFVFVFKLLCSFTKKKTGSVFPAFCHATFHHALITCCNVSRAGYIA